MTLSTPTQATNSSARRRGFTLVEMLVVIGVIVLLVGILVPAVNLAYTHAVRSNMQQNLQMLKAALEVYKGDQSSYPPIDYNDTVLFGSGSGGANYPGAVVLCWALLAPGNTTQDGAGDGNVVSGGVDGPAPGFRKPGGGAVYTYVAADKLKVMQDTGIPISSEPNWYFADRYGHPILYFKANQAADIYNSGYAGFVDDWKPGSSHPQPMYNLHDNGNTTAPGLVWTNATPAESTTANALIRMRQMLGDLNANGSLDPGERPATSEAYLLWSAGPDEMFGIDVAASNGDLKLSASYVPSCDDATTFTH